VIVHGTNTLSYKVKIRAKDQCFLPPLKDFKRDAGSQHNYFFQNRLRMILRFPLHFLSGCTKNLNWLETGSVFLAQCFLHSPVRAGTNCYRPLPDVRDFRFRNWPETKTTESVFVAKRRL